MKYRVLGRTGLKVSEIGFGCWGIGGNSYGKTDDSESTASLKRAFDSGVTFFDTADIYGNGHSEKLVGDALSAHRSKIVLATKVGWDFYHGGTKRNFDPAYIEFACGESLKRLKTDVIDVYQLHNPDADMLADPELFAPFEKLKQKGLIRHYGVSIHVPREGVAALKHPGVETLQLIYNLIDQRPRKELLPLAQSKGIGIIAREPFGCGILTGKYTKEVQFTGPDHRKGWNRQKIELDLDKLETMKSRLTPKASLPVAGLEFILAYPAVSTVIPGMKTLAQLEENLKASGGGNLSSEDVKSIERLFDEERIFQEGFFRS